MRGVGTGNAEIRVIGTVSVDKFWSAVGGEQAEGFGAVFGGGSGVTQVPAFALAGVGASSGCGRARGV
jgi:hypothetical protein